MLILQDPDGLVLWPKREVASIRPERARFQCVLRDGSVAHFPGAVPEGPWHKLGDCWVLPELLRREGEFWVDPASFPYPWVDLPPTPPAELEPDGDGLPCKPSKIWALTGEGRQALWRTDEGDVSAGMYAVQARKLHPDLVHAGRGAYVNRRRLRRILNERKRFRLVLDNAQELTVSYGPHKKLAADLGLPQLYQLEPSQVALYRERLRDYPLELKNAPTEWLRAHFSTARVLAANLLYQTVLWTARGRPEVLEYGETHRDYYYNPLRSPMYRAGFWRSMEVLREHDPEWLSYLDLVGDLVGKDRLFTFRELGFADPRPDLRHLGSTRPALLVVGEKHGLSRYLRLLAQEFGVSTLILGGLPSLLSTEYCAEAFLKLGIQRVEILSFVDFDPGGWVAASSFAEQMRGCGVEVSRVIHLVRPERFPPEVLAMHSEAIDTPTPQVAGKVKAWVAESGGVGGEARSIGAHHFTPYALVREHFVRLLSELEGRSA